MLARGRLFYSRRDIVPFEVNLSTPLPQKVRHCFGMCLCSAVLSLGQTGQDCCPTMLLEILLIFLSPKHGGHDLICGFPRHI